MKVLLLSLLLIPGFCLGQKDPCKKITRGLDQKGVITFHSPDLKHISIVKQLNTDTFFALHVHFADQSQQFEAMGAVVTFDDGTTRKDEGTKVDCKQEVTLLAGGYGTSSSAAHSGEYLIQGFFHITHENIDKFCSQKILTVQLGNATREVTEKEATKILNFIKCLKDFNQ